MQNAAIAHAEPGPLRQSKWTIAPGLVLFICLFLPAVKACDSTVYPIMVPLCYGPYLLGLLAAVIAWRGTARARVARLVVWLLMVVHFVVGPMVMVLDALLAPRSFTLLEFAGSIAVLTLSWFIVGRWHREDYQATLRALFIGSAASAIWFGMIVVDDDGLFGVHLSFGAAVALAGTTALWWRSVRRAQRMLSFAHARTV